MKGENALHPGHKSVRLKGYDYSSSGLYFVTICTYQKRCVLGRITAARMVFSRLGQVAHEVWIGIPAHFAHVKLHALVIMPNHLHGIIEIGCQAGAQHAAPLPGLQLWQAAGRRVARGSLSTIVRSFKAAITTRARKELNWKGEIWQRNYFERILRDGQEFSDATRYISENVMMWEQDRENPKIEQALSFKINAARHSALELGKA